MDDDARRLAIDRYREIHPRYEAFADALRVLVRQLCIAESLTVDVESRAKSVESLSQKLKIKREYRVLEDVPDLCGARIITPYISDIEAVHELLNTEFNVLEVVPHGAETPEAFGYASLHVLLELSPKRSELREWRELRDLKAEVQVRTILQHAWAVISHGLDYKSSSEVPTEVRRSLFRVAALLETGDEIFERFRKDVESLRAEYRDSASGTWQLLPLNLDSIKTVWPQLPTDELADVAEASGFLEGRAYESDDRIAQLVRVASAAGYKTVGDIESLMRNAKGDVLRAFATNLATQAESESERFVEDKVYAIPSDVATITILSSRPDLLDRDDLGLYFSSSFIEAARGASATMSASSRERKPRERDAG